MTYEVPNGVTESVETDIERTHEFFVNQRGYSRDNVLVTYSIEKDEMKVAFGSGVGSME